ncbi:MAG TPA: cupin domain-containing protein [Pyrinomonadaceae bacterium]|jgi:quercetin dioxygenase-like cupin family protein|nr:cupin domain-containing protein [Pyrinomonadaceae bacterium]
MRFEKSQQTARALFTFVFAVPEPEVIEARVELAPGMAFGRHRHPGEEIVHVLEGWLEYQLDDQPPVTLKAGDVLFIPAGTIHRAKNVGSDNGAELATYLGE